VSHAPVPARADRLPDWGEGRDPLSPGRGRPDRRGLRLCRQATTRCSNNTAGTRGNGNWGYIVGTYDKNAGANDQRLYLNGTRVAQMSDTLPIDLNSAALGIGRHVSGIADPFNGRIDGFASRTSSAPTAGSKPPGTT
jgi:Concanavalin A-like lectin/glucanases superfamily